MKIYVYTNLLILGFAGWGNAVGNYNNICAAGEQMQCCIVVGCLLIRMQYHLVDPKIKTVVVVPVACFT